jgi:hypothetical protein
VKGSPLWVAQPEVHPFYSASRQWARLFCPDIILGAYTPEGPWYSGDNMVDVTPPIDGLAQRLRDAEKKRAEAEGGRGFDAAHVAKLIEGEAAEDRQQ